jgi:hypothetical protein
VIWVVSAEQHMALARQYALMPAHCQAAVCSCKTQNLHVQSHMAGVRTQSLAVIVLRSCLFM